MLFNSLEFLIFLALFFAGWPLIRRYNLSRWGYLTVFSFFFYGWWDWRFLFLIAGSGLIDYLSGLAIVKWPDRKRFFLILSILGNVGSLGLFKYLDFAIGNVNFISDFLGMPATVPMANLLLPVGISFYTFQSMSYTIDIYRGRLEPTKNILHFFAYLSMFPQLMAGPIVRAADLLPQLAKYHKTTESERWEGMKLITIGFFKKVVVADTVAVAVNAAFAKDVLPDSGIYWWLIMAMFVFQVYCDFSGYSDIARGLAKWMGYNFKLNFDHPLIADSARSLWARWHISLTTWFRDYVYFPLGGSRVIPFKAARNIFIAMLVSGLWHGAAWTFVAWGGCGAIILTIEHFWDWSERVKKLPLGRHIAVFMSYNFFLLSAVFFRAVDFQQAIGVIARIFDFTALNPGVIMGNISGEAIALTFLMFLRQAYFHLGINEWAFNQSRVVRMFEPVTIALLLIACVFFRGPGAAFVYFQF
jgi:D-alanyl-lipoteichoic acid acyltransferase DltB (MBOAT superfamily)